MIKLFAACLLFLDLALGRLAADDAIFDVPALARTPLKARTLRSIEKKGVVTEEVRFHSEMDGETDVEIFAYFSYPKGAAHLPAFIWNPGGLGQASAGYTEPQARRGYAVLCIDFPQPGYRSTGNYPINRGLTVGADPKQAPIYHGVVALLKAVTYLESRPEVDPNRIGMAGSSWGGFFTTLMVGIDPRLKAGSCLYGTGSLQLGNAWWDGVSRSSKMPPTPEERRRWQTTLDPAWRLPTKKTPIAWITGTNDAFYSMPALMQSYAMAAGPKHLTLLPNWDHALPGDFTGRQVYRWLDIYLQGKPALPKVSAVSVRNENGRLIARWTCDRPPVAADLIASYGEPGNWRCRYWHTFKAEVTGSACRAELPAATVPCYLSGSVVAENGDRSSTPLIAVDSAGPGIKTVFPFPDFDGCGEWGQFEPAQIEFLAHHNQSGQQRWIPKLARETAKGGQAAILETGRTVLPPILSTAGYPHRFSCMLKADKPCTVIVQLGHEHKNFAIGREWTDVGTNFTPANTLMGGFRASLTTPANATVLVAEIHFQPLLPGKR